MPTSIDQEKAGAGSALTAERSSEVTLHELGESLSLALGAVQDELATYQSSIGSFLVDEFSLEIPLQLRIDSLGQPQSTVVTDSIEEGSITRLSFKVRPVVGARPSETPMLAHRPLSVLRVLSDDSIERLAEFRVFSVADFQRIATGPAGVRALRAFDIDVDAVLERIDVLTLPMDSRLAEALLEIDVSSPVEFMEFGAEELANRLSEHLGQEVLPEDIRRVQEMAREARRIRFSSEEPGADR